MYLQKGCLAECNCANLLLLPDIFVRSAMHWCTSTPEWPDLAVLLLLVYRGIFDTVYRASLVTPSLVYPVMSGSDFKWGVRDYFYTARRCRGAATPSHSSRLCVQSVTPARISSTYRHDTCTLTRHEFIETRLPLEASLLNTCSYKLQDVHRTLSHSPQRGLKNAVFKIWTISCDNSETVRDTIPVSINH